MGNIPLVTPIVAEDIGVPAPSFVSITPDGNPSGSLIFDENETITIRYTADRLKVEGLILLGSGSNLTSVSNGAQAVNFTKISSLKDLSTYEVKINVTTYTIFYAFAWSGSVTNGTSEEFDEFDLEEELDEELSLVPASKKKSKKVENDSVGIKKLSC